MIRFPQRLHKNSYRCADFTYEREEKQWHYINIAYSCPIFLSQMKWHRVVLRPNCVWRRRSLKFLAALRWACFGTLIVNNRKWKGVWKSDSLQIFAENVCLLSETALASIPQHITFAWSTSVTRAHQRFAKSKETEMDLWTTSRRTDLWIDH